MKTREALKVWMKKNDISVMHVAAFTKLSTFTIKRFIDGEKPTTESSQELIRLFLESQEKRSKE